jgi:hypothetical protein
MTNELEKIQSEIIEKIEKIYKESNKDLIKYVGRKVKHRGVDKTIQHIGWEFHHDSGTLIWMHLDDGWWPVNVGDFELIG